ncbi:hypothetical protein [uncultured Roseobacter sp.]|uniref:hypothetical protein n=1 Tax=uncultured Roseobacter sp. TaxID=114847 RepID=UPI0026373F1D|nr:hypothetical protein [uncultured Roseobacter sp.]
MNTETHRFTWQGIEIELTYKPRDFAGVIAHLEVRSINPKAAPLPITETGYLSHFHPIGTIEQNEGTLVEQVTAFLDERAKTKEWQTYVENSRQLSLF